MFRILSCVLLFCAAASVVSAVTLRQMSMGEMTASATAIVRARVTGSSASRIGPTIYTHYKLQATETWKGAAPAEVLLPGGTFSGLRQSFPGVPQLSPGSEYVLFLWTSSSTGITHVIGFSQGIFNVTEQADGSMQASRPATGETMLDSAGTPVRDRAVSITLADMKSRVKASALQPGVAK
jgi:hypothetical protein